MNSVYAVSYNRTVIMVSFCRYWKSMNSVIRQQKATISDASQHCETLQSERHLRQPSTATLRLVKPLTKWSNIVGWNCVTWCKIGVNCHFLRRGQCCGSTRLFYTAVKARKPRWTFSNLSQPTGSSHYSVTSCCAGLRGSSNTLARCTRLLK